MVIAHHFFAFLIPLLLIAFPKKAEAKEVEVNLLNPLPKEISLQVNLSDSKASDYYELCVPQNTYVFLNRQLYTFVKQSQTLKISQLVLKGKQNAELTFYNSSGFIFLPSLTIISPVEEGKPALRANKNFSNEVHSATFLISIAFLGLYVLFANSSQLAFVAKPPVKLPSFPPYQTIERLDILFYFAFSSVGYLALFYYYAYYYHQTAANAVEFSIASEYFVGIAVRITIVYFVQIGLLQLYTLVSKRKVLNIYLTHAVAYTILYLLAQILLFGICTLLSVSFSLQQLYLLLTVFWLVKSILIIRYVYKAYEQHSLCFFVYLCTIESLPMFFLI